MFSDSAFTAKYINRPKNGPIPARRGAAAVDYALVMGVIVPLASIVLWFGPRMIRVAYEMVCVLVSWPFM